MQSINCVAKSLSNIEYYKSPDKAEDAVKEDIILPSNMYTRGKWATKKYINAWTTYTKKGLKGDKNSNFYEMCQQQ